MHDILMSIILGIVEGFSEFLPVSSTGHLLVAENLLGLGDDWEAFTVVIQLGAILAVVVIYFQTFWKTLIGLQTSPHARRFALSVIVALIPSVIAGLAMKKLLDKVLLNPAVAMPFIAGCWIVGGIIILLVERLAPKPKYFEGTDLPLSKAFQIGCCQILSIIPGVSRSGATILELHHKGAALSHGQTTNIAIGFVVSFIVAFFVIKSFLHIVTKYGLKPFGWYRIAAGLLLAGYVLMH